jgi:hypothetical protein
MSGTYRDYHALIRQLLPFANEFIVAYYRRVYELSREITLSHDATGMQHDLLHHFCRISVAMEITDILVILCNHC